jgi:hypothetical protein
MRPGVEFHGHCGFDGVVYANDAPLNVVWKVSAPGKLQIAAGQFYLGLGPEGGVAAASNLHGPQGMAVGPDGSVYVADFAESNDSEDIPRWDDQDHRRLGDRRKLRRRRIGNLGAPQYSRRGGLGLIGRRLHCRHGKRAI